MNAQYTISRRVASDGYAELLVRFYAGRLCDQQAHTGIRVPVRSWNGCGLTIPKRNVTPEVQRLIELQAQMDALASYIYNEYARVCGHITTGWLKHTVEAFHGLKSHETHNLREYIMQCANSRRITQATVRMYQFVANDIPKHLTVEHTTTADIRAYIRAQHISQNSIVIKMQILRAVFNQAVTEGLRDDTPMAGMPKIREHYGSVIYLTAEERDALYAAPMPSRLLTEQRDVFVFQCWTGCRMSDLYNLREWNITPDGYLQYVAQKTKRDNGKTIRVPLSPVALEILQRYTGHHLMLPFCDPSHYNKYIRRVIAASGIDRQVIAQDHHTGEARAMMLSECASSHLARRTFSAIAFEQTGSERIVSSMTGHASGSRAFARYTEVTDDMKRSALGLENPDICPT